MKIPRRIPGAAVVLALAAAPLLHAATASERICTPDGEAHLVPARAELLALFAPRERQLIETKTGRSAPMGPPEVLMARIIDGKVVMVCVDTETAARTFLDAPAETLKRAKEK